MPMSWFNDCQPLARGIACRIPTVPPHQKTVRIGWPALVEQIAAGTLHVQIGKTFHLGEIVEAHRCMEENKAAGKIVVLT